jgi:hypothetical protein
LNAVPLIFYRNQKESQGIRIKNNLAMSGAMPPMGTPYAADGRPITKVGIAFSSKDRNITEWRCDL